MIPAELGIGRVGALASAVGTPVEKKVAARKLWSGRGGCLRTHEATDRFINEEVLLAGDCAGTFAGAHPERLAW